MAHLSKEALGARVSMISFQKEAAASVRYVQMGSMAPIVSDAVQLHGGAEYMKTYDYPVVTLRSCEAIYVGMSEVRRRISHVDSNGHSVLPRPCD